MGTVCSCLHMEDFGDYVNRNSSIYRNCVCLNCFVQNFFLMYYSLFQRVDAQPISSSTRGTSLTSTTSTDNSISDMYRSPPRPLPYDADPRCFRRSRSGKGSSHSHDESEPLTRGDTNHGSESIGEKWNGSSCDDGSKDICKSMVKLSSGKGMTTGYFYSSSEDEDVCPTCLEEYTEENPRIVTKCSHHFHLGCIYEWMERSQNCPVCGKVMAFDESP